MLGDDSVQKKFGDRFSVFFDRIVCETNQAPAQTAYD
jgi:hypothetical protein